jgi:hypothetical protein
MKTFLNKIVTIKRKTNAIIAYEKAIDFLIINAFKSCNVPTLQLSLYKNLTLDMVWFLFICLIFHQCNILLILFLLPDKLKYAENNRWIT